MYINYKKYLTFIFLISVGISSLLDNNYSISKLRKEEIKLIKQNLVSSSLFKYPVSNKLFSTSRNEKLDILNSIKSINLNPILGIRYSTSGFEMNPFELPAQTIWVSPGLKINYVAPIISPYSGFMFYAWGEFYKHSAYFLNKSELNKEALTNSQIKPFEYHPFYSMEYFVKTEEPDWGVDFDEGQGGIGIYSKNLNINFGKYKLSFGPFHRGNLSLSLKNPSFPQFNFTLKKDYKNGDLIEFSYMIGDLNSEIPDSSVIAAYKSQFHENSTRLPWLKRGIVNHRIDINFTNTFRIGFYEQIIYGARSIPWQYLIPVNLYWSAQHATGDFDNLQMGFDLDWIHHNGRTNLALFVDEWAPFTTFDKENHHNWFGFQFGHSQLFSLFNEEFYLRFENAILAPQLYEHKFPINKSFNQGYPIGYWSKGDSYDLWIIFKWINQSKFQPRFEFEYTIFGNPFYEVGRKYIQNDTVKREKLSFTIEYNMSNYMGFDFQFSYLKTKNIEYKKSNFLDFTINYKYNISY